VRRTIKPENPSDDSRRRLYFPCLKNSAVDRFVFARVNHPRSWGYGRRLSSARMGGAKIKLGIATGIVLVDWKISGCSYTRRM
jgi:hypothetical protein